MGFIILGIGSVSDIGYDKLRLLYLDEMGGMAIPMPKIFTIFTILSMTSLALSGMNGFVAELIVFFGIITGQKYLFMLKILS
ncbi:NAD(P)H-quinone oxidoreductase chain 4 [Medicago truncatula]|uniref:NAD(P)H-quinone oxidoreductase chain 4 n=1 Tax=Medicago truncatula TaxID=3880 RepID=G7LAZ5_MEDTR|nr:NAD(P)H-quinone oxidoreductase chain 4 [Medicago truncatula]